MDVSIVVSLFFFETFYCVESFMFFLLFLFTFDPITLMMQSIEVHFIYLFFIFCFKISFRIVGAAAYNNGNCKLSAFLKGRKECGTYTRTVKGAARRFKSHASHSARVWD